MLHIGQQVRFFTVLRNIGYFHKQQAYDSEYRSEYIINIILAIGNIAINAAPNTGPSILESELTKLPHPPALVSISTGTSRNCGLHSRAVEGVAKTSQKQDKVDAPNRRRFRYQERKP